MCFPGVCPLGHSMSHCPRRAEVFTPPLGWCHARGASHVLSAPRELPSHRKPDVQASCQACGCSHPPKAGISQMNTAEERGRGTREKKRLQAIAFEGEKDMSRLHHSPFPAACGRDVRERHWTQRGSVTAQPCPQSRPGRACPGAPQCRSPPQGAQARGEGGGASSP